MFNKKKADCPFWRGPCRKHECQLYIQVLGSNPQTGQDVNNWGCSFSFLPMLLIENSQMQRQTGVAVESLRNVNDTVNATAIAALQSLVRVSQVSDNQDRERLISGPAAIEANK